MERAGHYDTAACIQRAGEKETAVWEERRLGVSGSNNLNFSILKWGQNGGITNEKICDGA